MLPFRGSNQSPYTVAKCGYVEIEQQTDFQARELQVGENLGLVHRPKRGYGLDFHHDLLLDDEIRAKCIFDAHTFVLNRDGHLTKKCDSPFAQLDFQTRRVGRLHKSRPQLPMYLDSRAQDLPRDSLVLQGYFVGNKAHNSSTLLVPHR